MLYIVVYRGKSDARWKAMSEAEFSERRLAENFIECKRAAGWLPDVWDFAIVQGEIEQV